jgi:DNA-binding CsgD family transcriptional regulator
MADLFYYQRSPKFAKEANLNAIHIAMKCNDTLAILNFYSHLASIYDLTGRYDSVLHIGQESYNIHMKLGYEKQAYAVLPSLFATYLNNGQYEKAKPLMDLFETKMNLSDDSVNTSKKRILFYYYKAKYYNGINKVDSALYFYKKFLNNSNKSVYYENAYKGLMEVYHKLGKPDSVMKYSLLFANANDSACLISSAEEINRANALYNYNTSRRQADAMKQKAERYKYTITIGSILAILAVLFAIYIIIRYRRNAKKEFLELNTRYFETLDKYNQSEKDLRMLNDDINKFKTEKEKENESLRQAMAQYTNSNEIKEEWDAEKYILHCDVIRDLHNMATKGISASNVNWSKLTNLVSLHLSPIYSHITKSEYKLSDREILVCILIRLQFLPLEIAVLFNCSKQIVSNIRTNINRKLFQQEGTKTLDSNIKRL